jgi:hypothetical protein
MEDCIYQQQDAQIGEIMDTHKSEAYVKCLLIFLMISLECLGNEDLELLVGDDDDDVEPYLKSSDNIIYLLVNITIFQPRQGINMHA